MAKPKRGQRGGRPVQGRRRSVGVTLRKGRFNVCEPLFERGPSVSLGGKRIAPGRIVEVEETSRGARVLRELGDPSVAADVVAALLVERQAAPFTTAFDDEARQAADAARKGASDDRRDLTELETFTVDPASARDFDDAVSASRSGDGIKLWVHIADVSAHVRPGTRLDREAYRRATSTYVPGTVVPMLPLALSGDACSLAPGERRLAVTAEIDLAASGEVTAAAFYRSVIRSDQRLDYDELDAIFEGGKAPPRRVAEPLALAREAAKALGQTRKPGLEVQSSEPEFEFDAQGRVRSARGVPQTESHRLIERLMVLTNEQVATLLGRKDVPTLYRVHEQPDPERIRNLAEQLHALEVPTPALPKRISPSQAGALAVEASKLVSREAERRGHGREAYTTLVLRSLQQARYSERNLGHAGLGSPAYAHFTSPIRRYPDLIAHRALLSQIGAGERPHRSERLPESAEWCSERERDATRIERQADDICAAFLLADELTEAGPGASFAGEVVGLIEAGAFVRFRGERADVYEGFLPARRIGGRERYELDATETSLQGAGGGGAIRLGDPVEVTVDRVDAPRGRVDLLQAGRS